MLWPSLILSTRSVSFVARFVSKHACDMSVVMFVSKHTGVSVVAKFVSKHVICQWLCLFRRTVIYARGYVCFEAQ